MRNYHFIRKYLLVKIPSIPWGAIGGGQTTSKTQARKSIGIDIEAQISLDFLLGASIFLMALLFVFTFIPQMFVPYQSKF